MRIVRYLAAGLPLVLLAACAQAPDARLEDTFQTAATQPVASPASPGVDRTAVTGAIGIPTSRPGTGQSAAPAAPPPDPAPAQLTGRTIEVVSSADIRLRPREVVLTFDDGPHPTNTIAILNTLDKFGVKAVFFMVGQMAQAHPQAARAVALRGDTVATHTLDHQNLTLIEEAAAVDDIHSGQATVTKVLAPTGLQPAPFFRFPYLASTTDIQAQLSLDGTVIFGTDIDSEDYRNETPDAIIARTLAKLDKKGKGIVLFHDLHERTAALMPNFLRALAQKGYRVVQLVGKPGAAPGSPVITAEQPALRPAY